MINHVLLGLKFLLLIVLIPGISHAATFTVNNNSTASDATPGDGICEVTAAAGDCSLKAATEEAGALTGAHTINFDATVSSIIPFTTYDLSGADITLQGPGRDLLTLLADDFGTLENDSISGVTLVHGSGQTILGNNATLSDSEIHIPERAGSSVLLKNATGTATINSSELIGSVSTTPMITVSAGGTLNISSATLRDHSSGSNGGAIFLASGTLTVSDSVFSGNDALDGSAIFFNNNVNIVTISDSKFNNNTATSVIHASSDTSTVTISDSTFSNNVATRLIFGDVELNVTGSHFIDNDATLILESANLPKAWNISDSVFADNNSGGLLYKSVGVGSILTLSRSSFTGNTTTTIPIIEIEFVEDSFEPDTITNTVISDNQMDHGSATVAHVVFNSTSVDINNSTITHNVNLGTGQSGIYAVGFIDISNSIIAMNTNSGGADDCAFGNAGTSRSYNIIGASDGNCTNLTLAANDLSGTVASPLDPMLGPLTTDATTGLRYRAPLAGSPAIDIGAVSTDCIADIGGLDTAIPDDLLGNPRSIDGDNNGITACDAGAIEVQPDTTPAAFAFTDEIDAALSTVISSDVITVSDIDVPVAISITNGEYRINTDPFTSLAGTVSNGDTIDVRHTSSASNSTTTDTVLTIGGVSDTFTSTTVEAPATTPTDTTPAMFTFTDVTDAALSTVITSNVITVSDIDLPAAINITNGEYRINNGSFTSTAGVVNNGDAIDVRHTSSATNATATDSVLTIGGVADTFTSTTVVASAVTPTDTASTSGSGGGGSLGLFMLLLSLSLWLLRTKELKGNGEFIFELTRHNNSKVQTR